VKKSLKYLKNKFILTTVIFAVYTLFLDENDIFTLLNQRSKLRELNGKKVEMSAQLQEVQSTLSKLKYKSEVERFARENKFFKKDNEDIFVIFEEDQ
jgi:cell division protein DivIC